MQNVEILEKLFDEAIELSQEKGCFKVPEGTDLDPCLERPKDASNGDFASTIALKLAKSARMNPRQIAQAIVDNFPKHDMVASIDIAGPGFINVTLSDNSVREVINTVRGQMDDFGAGVAKSTDPEGVKEKINLEYISANPTGPMHVGHGRWAALGDSIARIMTHAGYYVYQEFYVNDHGVQMGLFAQSISARYMQLLGQEGPEAQMPADCYGGDYVKDIAQDIIDADGDKWVNVPQEERLEHFKQVGYKEMMSQLKETLDEFRTSFDLYFSESQLYEPDKDGKSAVDKAFDAFNERGLIYEKDGATWFKSTEYGDSKDRVLIKENGDMTYFMSDCAYHYNKLQRGFDHLIDIWGADHHGYIPRCNAMMAAWGYPDALEVILGQLVKLYRDGEAVRMSKRTGELITFQELIDEVGVDATRFMMLSKSSDQPIDFDIEVAKKQDSSNPVYYVQYAHARICSILRKAYVDLGSGGYGTSAFGSGGFGAQGADISAISIMPIDDLATRLIPQDVDLSFLTHESELDLCKMLELFPEVVATSAQLRAPHRVTHYAQDLAAAFHQFYTNCRVMDRNKKVKAARLALCDATRVVLALALGLLGVTSPVKM